MNDILISAVFKFLDTNHKKNLPVLLAFSGGPDSLALLHSLLEYRKNHHFSFDLAHVDHGWRSESRQEADQIRMMAEQLGLSIHLAEFNPNEMQGNLEAACRQKRLEFFSELCSIYNYQAVLFGHHADDLAETVLKRTLEGVALPYLSGMRPESEMMGMKLWRPLLNVNKATILNWLRERHLKGLEDQTNFDSRFLRAKFRQTILPQLAEGFGKEISRNLCHIGLEAGELRDYLDDCISSYLGRIKRNKWGAFLDLSDDLPQSVFELKHLLRRCCESEGFSLSRDALTKTVLLLNQRAANKKILMGSKSLYIDRRRLFICPHEIFGPPSDQKVISLNVSSLDHEINYGPCTIKITKNTSLNSPQAMARNDGWYNLWQDGLEVGLPEGTYTFAMPKLNATYPRSLPLDKWWTDHKVPAFLRTMVPVIFKQEKIYHEFLSGKSVSLFSKDHHLFKVLITFK